LRALGDGMSQRLIIHHRHTKGKDSRNEQHQRDQYKGELNNGVPLVILPKARANSLSRNAI
jgi:hypothetical protein